MNPLLLFQKLPRWFRRHKLLRLFAWCGGGGNVQRVRVNDLFDANIDVRDGFARLVAIEDEFEAPFFQMAQSLLPKSEPVFFDVGANFGLMSLGLWHLSGRTLDARLFEPNPGLCAIINRSMELNHTTGLKLVNAAAMDAAGEVYLNFELAHTGAGFVGHKTGGIPVQAMVLDDYLEDSGLRQVDLLKIDVEGNEGPVLAGLRRSLGTKLIRAIYFEYCPRHLERANAPHDPFAILQSEGYEVFAWDADALRRIGRPTHFVEMGNALAKNRIHLALLDAPPSVAITDLLALPHGVATQLDG